MEDDYLLKNFCKKEGSYPIIKEGGEDEFEFSNILRPIFTPGNPPGKKFLNFYFYLFLLNFIIYDVVKI